MLRKTGLGTGAVVGLAAILAACQLFKAEPQPAESLPAVPETTVEETPLVRAETGTAVSSYLAGVLSELRGDVGGAAIYYARAHTFDQENADLLQRAFSSNLANGNLVESKKLLESMLAEGVELPIMARLFQAAVLIQEQQFAKAQPILETLAAENSKILPFNLMQAYVQLALGSTPEQVIANLKALPENELMDGYRNYHIGRIYESSGKLAEAEKAYELAYDYDSSAILNVLALGRIYELNQKRTQAEEIYRTFADQNPESLLLHSTLSRFEANEQPQSLVAGQAYNLAEVVFGFATVMAAQNLEVAAMQLVNIAAYVDETYPYTTFYRGVLQEQGGLLEEARHTYMTIPVENPTWLAARVRTAEVLFNAGEQGKALSVLHRISQSMPEVPQITRTLAELYFQQKQYAEALNCYDRLVNSTPSERHKAIYLFARGASYERLGQYDAAVADLSSSLALEPNNPAVLNYLGYLWVDQGTNLDQGFDYISKAFVLKPTDGAIMDSLGWAYFKKGDREKAVNLLERARMLRPEDAIIHSHLGDVYAAMGQMNDAVEAWRTAQDIGLDTEKERLHVQKQLNSVGSALEHNLSK